MNPIQALISIWQRKIQPGFLLRNTDLVLDIGSGDKPFWRADVFLDKLSLDNRQRISGLNTVSDLGWFVDSDITKTPFKNRAFDFSFCSHLLEHVEDPAAVIDEITRISKAGYIEVPNGLIEAIQPFHSHLWFVYYADQTLTFVRKSQQMHDLLIKNGQPNTNAIGHFPKPFIQIHWQNKLKYQIINLPKGVTPFRVTEEFHSTDNRPNYYLILVHILRRLFYRSKHIDQQKLLKK